MLKLNDTHIIILILFGLCLVYFCFNQKKKEEFNDHFILPKLEGFLNKKNNNKNNSKNSNSNNNNNNKNDNSNKYQDGLELDKNTLKYNKLLQYTDNLNNIYIHNNKPVLDQNDKSKLNTTKKSLFLDSKTDNLVLKNNASLVLDLNDDKLVDGIQIKGLSKFRVDYSMDDFSQSSNQNQNNGNKKYKNLNFKPIFYGKNNDNKLKYYKIRLDGNKILNARYLKIHNQAEKSSKPIKLEVYGTINNDKKVFKKMDKENYQTDNKINLRKGELEGLSRSDIMTDNFLVKLNKNSNSKDILGLEFKTNIPKFKILEHRLNNKNQFLPKDKKVFFNGGINGSTSTKIFLELDESKNTTSLSLIPFLNKTSNNDKYFIKDIKFLVKSSRKSIEKSEDNQDTTEGFQNSLREESVFLNDINNAIDLDKACEIFENQQNIQVQKKKLENNMIQERFLKTQMREIKKLEEEIEDLTQIRKKQIEKFDKNNVARFYNNKGKAARLKELYNQAQEKLKLRPKINVNIIDNSKPGNDKTSE